jgi:hypothetical protein
VEILKGVAGVIIGNLILFGVAAILYFSGVLGDSDRECVAEDRFGRCTMEIQSR